jgi:hypothetical protein
MSYRAALDFALYYGQPPDMDFGVCCHDPLASVGPRLAQNASMP